MINKPSRATDEKIKKPQAPNYRSKHGSRDLVGAWYSNVLQTRLLLINLRVDKAFKSIVSSHLILLSFQQMMDKMLVAAESPGLSSTDSNDSNNQGREGGGEEGE